MIPDGRGTDEQALTDGGCAHALGQIAEDGTFTLGKSCDLPVPFIFILRATRSGLNGKFRNWLR